MYTRTHENENFSAFIQSHELRIPDPLTQLYCK